MLTRRWSRRPSPARWLAAIVVCLCIPPADAVLRVGICKRDITPVSPALQAAYTERFGFAAEVNHTDPIFLAGFDVGRQATGYNDRLWARGVVLDDGTTRVGLVALDLVGYFTNEVDTIRGLLSPESAIDYVVVHSTHQHQGPDTMGLWGPDVLVTGIDFGYLDTVNDAVAECLEFAAANLRRAQVRYTDADATGLSLGIDVEDDGFGVGDGKVLVGDDRLAPETDGRIVDPRLSVMQLTVPVPPYRVIATLVNFASHPEALGSDNTLITSDFPHYARERLEREYGGLAIWVSGDLGVLQGPLDIDVLDPDTGEAAERRTFRFAQLHGEQLAERIIETLDPDAAGRVSPPIVFATARDVPVPLDNPYFRSAAALGTLNARRSLFTDGVPDPAVGFPFPPPFVIIPQALGEDLHTEVGVMRIGDGGFVVLPTELDPQIGESYRQRLGAPHTFIIGLGNDEMGYQLPADKWDDSCHACAPYVLFGLDALCPVQPIDCSTVFQNNVGRQVDPTITDALLPLIESLE